MNKTLQMFDYTPKYKIGEMVYAISLHNDSKTKYGQEKDEWDRDYARIYKVYVSYISIDRKGVEYIVTNINDDTDWGDSISEEYISTNYDELVEYLFKLWKL